MSSKVYYYEGACKISGSQLNWKYPRNERIYTMMLILLSPKAGKRQKLKIFFKIQKTNIFDSRECDYEDAL